MSKVYPDLEPRSCLCGCGKLVTPRWDFTRKTYTKYKSGHWTRTKSKLVPNLNECCLTCGRFGCTHLSHKTFCPVCHTRRKQRQSPACKLCSQRTISLEQEAGIVEMYRLGLDARPMSRMMGIGLSTIRTALKRSEVKMRSGSEIHRKYTCNKHYFDDIDCEGKAYWLGFIAADGHVNVRHGSYNLVIGLTISDTDHVKKFQQSIESDHVLLFPKHLVLGKNYRSVRLSISCKHLVEALVRQGIPPQNKFGKIRLPDLSPNLLRHYCRGYVDGDGSIFRSARGCLTFTLTSDRIFLTEFQQVLMQECYLSQTKISSYKNSKASYLVYGGNRQVPRILHYLYHDATVFLDRKIRYYLSLPGAQLSFYLPSQSPTSTIVAGDTA